MKTQLKIIVCLAGFLALASCVFAVDKIDSKVVRSGDTGKIKVVEMRSLIKDGLLTVQATIQNKGAPDPVSYRFSWYGQGKLSMNKESWKPLNIQKGETDDVVGIAPSPDANDFKLELRPYK